MNNPIRARFYDNPDFIDRYAVVYSPLRLSLTTWTYPYSTLGRNPRRPDGVWQHGTQANAPIDNYGKHKADYAHLGKRITWGQLPPDVQRALIAEAQEATS
jgi:hypothetical protein